MTWAKIDDLFPEHPKVVGLSDKAFRVHVTALCYCARHLTDGELPNGWAKFQSPKAVSELLGAGLWTQGSDGYVIHDYLEYNPSRSSVEHEREQAAQRMAKSRRSSTEQDPKFNSPVPVPQPVPLNGSRDSVEIAVGAKQAGADAPFQSAVSENQAYLLRQLPVRSGKGWKAVTFGAVSKLNKQYGQGVVTQALQRAIEEASEPLHSAYPLLEAMCKDITGVQA